MIEQKIQISLLYDFYGALLTERQKKFIELHYLDDLSLAEIAEEYTVSRQAVHDILKRSVQAMLAFEAKLNLIVRYEKERANLSSIDGLLAEALEKQNLELIKQARSKFRSLLV